MSTTSPQQSDHDDEPGRLSYETAEGLHEDDAGGVLYGAPPQDRNWREWMMVGVGLTALLGILAIILSLVSVGRSGGSSDAAAPAATLAATGAHTSAASSASVATAPAPTLAQAKGVAYERFQPVDPTVPAVPAGPVKRFTVSTALPTAAPPPR